MLELGFGICGIEVYQDGAHLPCSPAADDGLRAVGHEKGHSVSLLYAFSCQNRGELIAQLLDLGVGHLPLFEEHHGVIRVFPGRLVYVINERLVGIRLQRSRDRLVIVF